MRAGRELDARGSESAGGSSVHENFSALWIRINLRPRDVDGGTLGAIGNNLSLNVFLHLHAANIGIVTGDASYKIVFSGVVGQGHWSLAGLIGAIVAHVRA